MPAVLFFCAAGLVHGAAPVLVVWGESSPGGESQFVRSLALHAERWCRENGVEAQTVSDRDLPSSLDGRKILFLIGCSGTGEKFRESLSSFAGAGGKFIVAYSASPFLASLCSVRTGAYRTGMEYRGMVFSKDAPQGCPESIAQSSKNIVSAYPLEGKSRTIAVWHDASGLPTGDAAVIEGENSFWLTHVLLADGEAAKKRRLLMAMCGKLCPGLWPIAAEARLSFAEKSSGWGSPGEALSMVSSLPRTKDGARAVQLLEEAARVRDEAVLLAKEGRHFEAWSLADRMLRNCHGAYAIAKYRPWGEIRAVWDQSGMGLYPGDWEKTMETLSRYGISDIFLYAASLGHAHYESRTVPRSAVFAKYGDQLSQALAAAKSRGIRVHPWIVLFGVPGPSKSRIEFFREESMLLGATGGGSQMWISPHSPKAKEMILAIAEEILENYGVAGLHLDYARYQDYYGSLGDDTRELYSAYSGKNFTAGEWPEKSKYGALFRDIARWRKNSVSEVVAGIRAIQIRKAPDALLTAAVLGKYPSCVEYAGQDWVSWLRCGYLDYAVPMNYTEDISLFRSMAEAQLSQKSVAARIIGGIGVTSAQSRLSAPMAVDQIEILREGGAAGFALFDLDATLLGDILPYIGGNR